MSHLPKHLHLKTERHFSLKKLVSDIWAKLINDYYYCENNPWDGMNVPAASEYREAGWIHLLMYITVVVFFIAVFIILATT